MTRTKQLAILAVRLFALYMIFIAATSLLSHIGLFAIRGKNDELGLLSSISGIAIGAVELILGYVLWKYSIKIGEIASNNIDDKDIFVSESSIEDKSKVAVSLFGLYLLSGAVPNAIILLLSFAYPEINPKYIKSLNINRTFTAQIPIVDYINAVLQLIIGFWLLFGSKGLITILSSIWRKGKTIGTEPAG